MRVRFWGTRGSLPVAPRGEEVEQRIRTALRLSRGHDLGDDAAVDRFIEQVLPFPTRHSYGGDSSCVEIEITEGQSVFCDMGSGLRALGLDVMARHGPVHAEGYTFFLSHVHWDHIMGFPFFPPAYIPGNKIRIHGGHAVLEQALRRQQSDPCFPVQFDQLGADISFHTLPLGAVLETLAGAQVKLIRQPHHGDSYGYRFEYGGRSVVYSTDGEHNLEDREATRAYVEFLRGADLVIFDAMYSMADLITIRQDWGHSSNIIGVDLCRRAGVGHYCMFHHEPAYDDATIQRVLDETRRYEELTREEGMPPLRVSSAYDGLEIPL